MAEFIIIWVVIILIAVVVESLTTQLVSIWFAIGGIAGLIAAVFKLPFYSQAVLFFVVSGITLAGFLLYRKFFGRKAVPEKTNYDRAIGKEAFVIQRVDNIDGTGQIREGGQIWSARSDDESVIEEGEKVVILRIEGVKAIISKIS